MFRVIVSNLFLILMLFQAGVHAEPAAERQQELLHLLKHDCGSCHGLRLEGGLGPALVPDKLNGKPVDFLVMTILEGRPGTAMPPWKPFLSEAEARWLADGLSRGDFQ